MTTIGLIRHGITDWNIAYRAQGQTDIPLNETGRAQAAAVAARIASEPERWDAIVASDLSRARDTAEAIGQAIGLPVAEDARLRERDCGRIEGTTEAERIALWGPFWHQMNLGVETEGALSKRGAQILDELAERYQGQRLLVVSHGALIRMTLRHIVPQALRDKEIIGNTSLTLLHRSPSGWECSLVNCSAHLEEADE